MRTVVKKTSKRFKTRAKKVGLPPGSLIHIGERLSEHIKITLMDYNGDHLQEKIVERVDEIA